MILFNLLIERADNIYILDANINHEIIAYVVQQSNCKRLEFIYHTKLKIFDNIYITHE